jgi:uncharacterized protein
MNIKDKRRLKPLYKFLNWLRKEQPNGHQQMAVKANLTAWEGVDCLVCANCCKTMTPTYKSNDIKRIAAFLQMSTDDFKKKWLRKERGAMSWVNKTKPCQFLDLKTNMCNVYEVRPADCAGFPHLTKKRMIDYIDVHKQNLDECPATFKMVQRMNDIMGTGIGS